MNVAGAVMRSVGEVFERLAARLDAVAMRSAQDAPVRADRREDPSREPPRAPGPARAVSERERADRRDVDRRFDAYAGDDARERAERGLPGAGGRDLADELEELGERLLDRAAIIRAGRRR